MRKLSFLAGHQDIREMKRYGNLFTKIANIDNIKLSHRNAKKGKSHYKEVQQVEEDPNKYITEIKEILDSKNFKTAPYRKRVIHEPKERVIYKLPYFPDRIVHHAIMNVLQPIWDKTFIYDLYSAIPGKGLHAGVKRLRKFMKDKENTMYCLKFDIKSFYPSINHDILYEQVTRKIKCKDTLLLLEDIIRSPGGDKNLPIGNYLSQYLSNIYLSEMDHWLKEEKHLKYYIRYCDDGVCLHSDKRYLTDLLGSITGFLDTKLRLELNPKTQIFQVDIRGVDFLGYRSFRNYTLLRKGSAKRFKKKVRYITEHHDELDPGHIISSIMSYYGWIKHADGYNLTKRYILENIELLAIMDRAAKEINIKNPIYRIETANIRRNKNRNRR